MNNVEVDWVSEKLQTHEVDIVGDFGGADDGGNHEAVVGVEDEAAIRRLDGKLLQWQPWVRDLLQLFVGGWEFQVHAWALLSLVVNL